MEPTSDILNQRKKYAKRSQWTDTAEQILLELWEEKILQLRGNRKNQHVYAEMSAELQKNGFTLSPLEVKNKVHNLTGRYRKEKLLIGPSGGSPSVWPLYNRIHSLLGAYKYFNLSEVTYDSISAASTAPESTAPESTASSACDSILESNEYVASSAPSTSTAAAIAAAELTPALSLPPASPSPLSPLTLQTPSPSSSPTLPAKKIKFQQQIMQQIADVNHKIDTQMEKMEEMDKKMHTLECRKTELLEKVASKQCAVMDALSEYMNSKK